MAAAQKVEGACRTKGERRSYPSTPTPPPPMSPLSSRVSPLCWALLSGPGQSLADPDKRTPPVTAREQRSPLSGGGEVEVEVWAPTSSPFLFLCSFSSSPSRPAQADFLPPASVSAASGGQTGGGGAPPSPFTATFTASQHSSASSLLPAPPRFCGSVLSPLKCEERTSKRGRARPPIRQ